MPDNTRFTFSKRGLLMLSIALASSPVLAQEADENKADESDVEVISVTGYRGSLVSSTNAKRESNGFSDEIFADDIGKMPSLNLAESLARIPGVKIGRQVTGEGQRISVRGLGAGFTKIVLNGNSISVASIGDINSSQSNREVDLDIFPTELFSSLSVNKTMTAQQIEGGVSGYINMRTAHASNMGDGHNFKYSIDAEYKESTESTGPKGSFTYSYSGDKFGVLATVVAKKGKTSVDGYETVGNIDQTGCVIEIGGSSCRNAGESGTFRYTDVASADYAAAHPGVNVGDRLDLNQVSGLTDEQLLGFGMPYIGRLMTTSGDKTNLSSLLSFQYYPNEDMELVLDTLTSDVSNDFVRSEFSHIYRRNYDTPSIPANIVIENNRLQSGQFYGSRPWIGSRDYKDDISFLSIMPSFSWQINDTFAMDISASKMKSTLDRDNPYGFVYTGEGTLDYDYKGDIPSVNHSNLDNYDDYTYESLRFGRMQKETNTEGLHVDFAWGANPDFNGIKFGFAIDKMDSRQQGMAVDDLDAYLEANNIDQVEANITDYVRSVDIGSSFENYSGLTQFGELDWDAFKEAINYSGLQSQLLNEKYIEEEVKSVYVEANAEAEIVGRLLRVNTGLRFVDTDQHVSTLNGETNESYTRVLPSFSLVYDVVEDVKLRASASRSLTRANPSDMYPDTAWDGSGIDAVEVGNPALAPFESTNFDIGGEWYFSDLGYVGITYYTKDITGFTRSVSLGENFNNLGKWGVDITDINDTQQAQLDICNPDCTVSVRTKENTEGVSKLNGFEFIWVQPLDFIVNGLGFNASANKIQDDSPEGAEITGISDSYNATLYYEMEGFQTRVTYYNQDGATQFESWGSTVRGKDRAQVDLAASYNLPVLTDYNLTVTFDAYNLTNEPLSTYIGDDKSQSFNVYYPGVTYNLGIRGSF